MAQKTNNYELQMAQAKKLFLTYDQPALIRKCRLQADEKYIYTKLLSEPLRICRATGDMEICREGCWQDANSFNGVMTVLDWLCDSAPDRYITGKWVNIVNLVPYFHASLQEEGQDANAELFDKNPAAFAAACRALGGELQPGADTSYAIELIDGLRILVQLWHGDEEFPPRLRFLWDENTLRYLRYETTWYALGLLTQRIRERM